MLNKGTRDEIYQLCLKDDKISLIKLVRGLVPGMGLADAKLLVERACPSPGFRINHAGSLFPQTTISSHERSVKWGDAICNELIKLMPMKADLTDDQVLTWILDSVRIADSLCIPPLDLLKVSIASARAQGGTTYINDRYEQFLAAL